MEDKQMPLSGQIPSITAQNDTAIKASQIGWAVEVLAHGGTTVYGSQNLPALSSLPALLGLDTLSLSLPNSSTAEKKSPKQTTASATSKAASISRIKIEGIPTDRVHLLFSSPALETGIRSGFWIYIPAAAVGISLRFRWNRDSEELEPSPEDEALENETPEASFKTFNYGELLRVKPGASADRSSAGDEWALLTQFITSAELDRLVPTHSTNADGYRTWPVSTLSTSTTESDIASVPAQPADIHFTTITLKNTFPPSSIGRDRTQHSLDKSWYLSSILPSDASSLPETVYGSTLLAEFALSFLLASALGNGSASQHWKDILRVSLRCTSAVTNGATYTFFVALLQLLESQLRYLDLFPSSSATLESHKQHAEQNTSTTAGHQASLLFESEDDLAALYELLFAFGRKNLADTMTPASSDEQVPSSVPTLESDSPRTAVRKAYLSLATSTTTTTPSSSTTIPLSSWDLATALSSASADDEDDKQQRRLQRRFLRGMEGFGYGSSSGPGYADVENGITDVVNGDADGDEEDEDEDGPVVLDLEGLLAEAHEDSADGVHGEGGFAGIGEVKETSEEHDDELEDEELDDLRY